MIHCFPFVCQKRSGCWASGSSCYSMRFRRFDLARTISGSNETSHSVLTLTDAERVWKGVSQPRSSWTHCPFDEASIQVHLQGEKATLFSTNWSVGECIAHTNSILQLLVSILWHCVGYCPILRYVVKGAFHRRHLSSRRCMIDRISMATNARRARSLRVAVCNKQI